MGTHHNEVCINGFSCAHYAVKGVTLDHHRMCNDVAKLPNTVDLLLENSFGLAPFGNNHRSRQVVIYDVHDMQLRITLS